MGEIFGPEASPAKPKPEEQKAPARPNFPRLLNEWLFYEAFFVGRPAHADKATRYTALTDLCATTKQLLRVRELLYEKTEYAFFGLRDWEKLEKKGALLPISPDLPDFNQRQ